MTYLIENIGKNSYQKLIALAIPKACDVLINSRVI